MKDNQHSNFFLGVAVGAAALYLLGTKNGRNIVKKMMDSVEQLENSAEDIFDLLEDELSEGLDIEHVAQNIESNHKKEAIPSGSLHSVIDKIKSSIALKEVTNNKKYLSKDGMIVK